MKKPVERKLLFLTLDPVHIGTGGYRLGRVDLSIVREPGTDLPKIPGTSLHGALRTYAAYELGRARCAGWGQDTEEKKKHCGSPACPICYTFGYARGPSEEGGKQGALRISDARILLFPIRSVVGPLWITSPATLYDFCGEYVSPPDDKTALCTSKRPLLDSSGNKGKVNLGWLLIDAEEKDQLKSIFNSSAGHTALKSLCAEDVVKEQIVCVSDTLFSELVNSALEVRTSVSIDPETGAAAEGALFTYEAIPRATILWCDTSFYGPDKFPNERCVKEELRKLGKKKGSLKQQLGSSADEQIESEMKRISKDLSICGEIKKQVKLWRERYGHCDFTWEALLETALSWFETLGVGGMLTRGIGRMRAVFMGDVESCRKKTEEERINSEKQSAGGADDA